MGPFATCDDQPGVLFGKRINARGIYTRRMDLYPFDTVAGEMIAKAFAICRSAIVLLQSGYPDEAFGLCRSLYECSMYLRYITSDTEKRDELSRKFLGSASLRKRFGSSYWKESDARGRATRRRDSLQGRDQIPNDSRAMFAPWSGVKELARTVSKAPHPTDAEDSTEGIRTSSEQLLTRTRHAMSTALSPDSTHTRMTGRSLSRPSTPILHPRIRFRRLAW